MNINGNEVNNLFLYGHRFGISDLVGKHAKANGTYRLASSVDLDTGLPNNYSSTIGNTIPDQEMTIIAQIKNSNGHFTLYIEKPGIDISYGGWIEENYVTIIENNGGVNSTPVLMFIYCMEVMPSC